MKKKIISKLKNNKLYVLSFIIGLAIISILYRFNRVTPFGGKSLLCVDFYHQYGPMLAELAYRIKHFDNLIYSFNMAMGLPFFRNFLNYLSSPFNIILLFFSQSKIVTSYSYIIGLKAVVSCVTMVYYLSKKFKTKELYLIPLGIIYAFSAYFSAYYWNIMWLDGMVFLPIITLGIENIVNKQKWKLYTISLAIMLIANYFIGYMICIYSVVYFIIYNIYKVKLTYKKKEIIPSIKKETKKFIKNGLIFAAASLLAGSLTAFLLIPMATSMASISATGGDMPTTQYYLFELVDFLKGHLTGVSTTVFASDTITNPNVSCGILSVALLLLYILNVDIPLKNKVCYFLILGFFILAFFMPQLDYILHAFHVPNDLPYRYSFLYSFVLVVICAYSLINIKNIKFPLVAVAYVFLMLLLATISTQEWADITSNMVYINMILLTLYFIFYGGLYFIKGMNNIFYLAIIAVACIDVIVSINYNWDITQELSNFYEDYDTTEELLNYVEDYDNEKFYRIENTNMMTLNDGSWYDYHGMTTFSSMAYESMANLQHLLGMPGNEINSYYYVQSTPIYDLMFDIKYFIGNTNDVNRYIEIKTIDETANEFTYNVGLAYGVNNNLKNWNYVGLNPFAIQNEYIERATGVTDTLKEATLRSTEEIYDETSTTILKYEYENPGDNLYLYTNNSSIDFIVVGDCLYYQNENYGDIIEKTNEITYSYVEDYSEEKVINISSSEEFITVYVSYTNYYSKSFDMYTIDNNVFSNAVDKLRKNKLDITSFKESEIEGNIVLEDDMDIYTSIPYDEGWHAYIDGKEVKTYALADALLCIEGTSGTHKLKLVYKIPHLKLGILISTISLAIIILDILREKGKIKIPKRKNKKKNKKNKKAEE